jgi:hypothetical protein
MRIGIQCQFSRPTDTVSLPPKKERVLLALLKDSNVRIAVSLYGIVCFLWIIFDEVFAFWLMLSPSEGGLGFTSSNIGVQLGITGFFLIIFQVTFHCQC